MKFNLPLKIFALLTTGAWGQHFYFWRLGHLDGPHDSSKALGISRDGKTAVGTTKVVDFNRAWRCNIDWAVSTDDGVPPLFNEVSFAILDVLCFSCHSV